MNQHEALTSIRQRLAFIFWLFLPATRGAQASKHANAFGQVFFRHMFVFLFFPTGFNVLCFSCPGVFGFIFGRAAQALYTSAVAPLLRHHRPRVDAALARPVTPCVSPEHSISLLTL